jgi:prepilin-type N-terminal cleavage/methylation domain-containing protein
VATPSAATERELEAFESDCELELDEDGSDFVLELDDEVPSEAVAGESATSDRRRSARVPFEQRIVALDEQAARVVVGRDLCLGGMRIAANPDLAIGDVLRLALHAGSEMEPLVVLAGVERDDGEDGLVLAFASLTGPQRERLEKILTASGAIQGPADEEGSESESLIVGELLGRVTRGRDGSPTRAGFTLVELMIVVAIIGLMSSIAVPLFGRYPFRARSSEAATNPSAIRVVQEAHFAELGAYLSANAEPPLIPGPSPAF